MRFKMGDRVRILDHSTIPICSRVGKIGTILDSHYSHLSRLFYDVLFPGLFATESFLKVDLEFVYRPSLDELLTDEQERVRLVGLDQYNF